VGRIIHGVQVESQVPRRALEGGDELVEEDVAQPLQGRDRDGVLEAGRRGLAGQTVVLGGAVGEELEDGVVAQGVVVVLVLVASEDAVHAGPDHLHEGVLREVGVPGVIECFGKGPGQADVLVELADGE
jgi:hypothetical protein